MPSPRPPWSTWPPVLRALAAQALAFLLLLMLARLVPGRLPVWVWPLLQAFIATALASSWGLGPWWGFFQILLPFALAWQLGNPAPSWIYPVILSGLLLVFGGGILTRVPLYNSGPAAWKHLLALIPENENLKMADLGAGLGGPLAFLARRRPQATFIGVEASPLVWLIAWLRVRYGKGGPPAPCGRDVPPLTPTLCPGEALAARQFGKGEPPAPCGRDVPPLTPTLCPGEALAARQFGKGEPPAPCGCDVPPSTPTLCPGEALAARQFGKGEPPAPCGCDVPPLTPTLCPGEALAARQFGKGGPPAPCGCDVPPLTPTRPLRRNCQVLLGSLWSLDLQTFDIVFAFLSPAPMPALWQKVVKEMRPGTLFISHSFDVPGVEPEGRIPVPGRHGACLLLYRIPDSTSR